MKQIKYPPRGSAEFKQIISDYKGLFTANLSKMEAEWITWKNNNHVTTINETVEDLLVADTDAIADVYDRFKGLPISSTQPCSKGSGKVERSDEYKELDKIFNYANKYDDVIANFFESRADELHISTCHYCELAYINTYVISRFGGVRKRQFDVDHFLPKKECPIIGLSLFNFVPSCQVCNSRIKSSKILGDNMGERIAFNPASDQYQFDKNVKIRLRMWRRPSTAFRNKSQYYIYFRCKNGYDKPVDFFHLQDRYEFHKKEAMRLLKLKADYPPSTIQRIANLLGKSASEVREDIFHKKYLTNNDRCFAKLTRDILK